ncbi:MAG: PQQ-binding-like beta-propeller repeat protein [Acidobacteriota bacterium]
MSPYPAEERWKLALNNAVLAQAPPAYDGPDGFFPIQGDRIVAYDLRRGVQRWLVPARPLSAPAIGGGLLFLEQNGTLSALHVADGSVAWTMPLTDTLSVPLVLDHGRLVAATATAILLFSAEDGLLQWRREIDARPHQRPSLGADHVYVPVADGRVLALRADNGEMVWERRLPGAPNEILVSESQLFVGSNDNYLYCLNAGDGVMRWRSPRTGSDVVSRPAVDDDHVYFISLDNVLRALNRRNGVQQWKKGLTFRPAWSPIVGADTVLVTSIQGPLFAFYRKDGAAAGQMETGADQIGAPPYAFPSDDALGPIIVVVTSNRKAGATITASSRRIEPQLVPLGTLPGLVPAPRPPAQPGETPPADLAPPTESDPSVPAPPRNEKG